MTHAADGDGESQVQTEATGLPCRCQRKEPTAHSADPDAPLGPSTQAPPALPLARCLCLTAPRSFCVCVRVFLPRHTPLFTTDSLPPCTVGGRCEAAGPPAHLCRVTAGSSLPRQPQQRRPRKDAEGPGFLGAPSSSQPSSQEAGIGAGQTWLECPSPRVGGHSGPFEISNPMSTIKREPGASQGRQGTVSGTRVMGKMLDILSYKNRKNQDKAL